VTDSVSQDRRLAEWPRPPKIDQPRVLNGHSPPGAAIVRVHKLDSVRQLARLYHREARPGGLRLIRDHKSDCVPRPIEIPYDTPNAEINRYEHRYGAPGTSPCNPPVIKYAQQDQTT
jgi:hypothetical protein